MSKTIALTTARSSQNLIYLAVMSDERDTDAEEIEPSEVEPPQEDEPTPAEDAGESEEPY